MTIYGQATHDGEMAGQASLTFDGESIRTPLTALTFSGLGPEKAPREGLVDQLREGWNSLLDWLREVQAWNQPAEAVE